MYKHTFRGVCVRARVCKMGFTYTTAYIADTHRAKILRYGLGILAAFTFHSPAQDVEKGPDIYSTSLKKKYLDVLKGHSHWACKLKAAEVTFFYPPFNLGTHIYYFLYIYMYKNKYIYIKKREKHMHTHRHKCTHSHTHTYTPLYCVYTFD